MSTAKVKTYRNPRRDALARLKTIKDRLQWCVNQWTVTSTVAEMYPVTMTDPNGAEYATTNYRMRARTTEEYPENGARDWQVLYDQAREAAIEANALADFAARQWQRCIDERNGAKA